MNDVIVEWVAEMRLALLKSGAGRPRAAEVKKDPRSGGAKNDRVGIARPVARRSSKQDYYLD